MKRFTLDKLPLKVLSDLDVENAFMASRAIIAAEHFEVFRLLHANALPLERAAGRLGLGISVTERLFNVLRALGLLRHRGPLYSNTRLATEYFVKDRSIYWTRQYSRECAEMFQRFALLEVSLKSGSIRTRQRRSKQPGYVQQMEREPARARDFTLMLYHLHQADASQLAKVLDLNNYHTLLDVGGGSGVMSIALARRNPTLRASILDIEPVCKVATQIIRRQSLSRRVSTIAGDMNKVFPLGFDVILFSDLGPMTSGLLDRARRALPRGGLLVIVDGYLSEDRTRPLEIPLYRLVSTSAGWETCGEVIAALRECGFHRVCRHPLTETMTAITAIKR